MGSRDAQTTVMRILNNPGQDVTDKQTFYRSSGATGQRGKHWHTSHRPIPRRAGCNISPSPGDTIRPRPAKENYFHRIGDD